MPQEKLPVCLHCGEAHGTRGCVNWTDFSLFANVRIVVRMRNPRSDTKPCPFCQKGLTKYGLEVLQIAHWRNGGIQVRKAHLLCYLDKVGEKYLKLQEKILQRDKDNVSGRKDKERSRYLRRKMSSGSS